MQINLLSVKSDTKERFEDIQVILKSLKEKNKVDYSLILKSSLMLMIYNAIEGTVNNLVVELFDAICQNKLSITHLPTNLRNTIFMYHLKKIGQDINKLESYCSCNPVDLCAVSYLEINKYLNLFSGNLDSRSIREISKKLGINLPSGIDEPVLLQVKNYRNKLAHGETKFRNTCQDITVKEIEEVVKKVRDYLGKLIDIYENSLSRI